MENSILNSTKKLLGLDPNYKVFDLDILSHINSAMMTLSQLGIISNAGYMVVDETDEWSDVVTTEANVSAIRTYVYLKVKYVFDPPNNSFGLDAIKKQMDELEWRMNVQVDHTPPEETSTVNV